MKRAEQVSKHESTNNPKVMFTWCLRVHPAKLHRQPKKRKTKDNKQLLLTLRNLTTFVTYWLCVLTAFSACLPSCQPVSLSLCAPPPPCPLPHPMFSFCRGAAMGWMVEEQKTEFFPKLPTNNALCFLMLFLTNTSMRFPNWCCSQ